MKKTAYIIVLALLAMNSQLASAIIARPEPFNYTQPDGSVITLQMHGDEFHNWTTCDGQVVALDKDGYYRPTGGGVPSYSLGTKRMTRMPMAASSSPISTGSRRFLVILIEFSDLSFTVPNPQQAFSDLLVKRGYSDNGATGSVYDYYYDNSAGQFDPQFDVYGPVTLSRSYSYYGEPSSSDSDAHPDEALYEACSILDSTSDIDFSKYDIDGDGYVDGVFFFYAGNNEAEGGGSNTIWPHAWALYYYNAYFDGVRVYSYACTSEYSGTGKIMCGIGTFCHEFGHTLGLFDLYDTDYDSHGYSENVFSFSTWGSGSYNNSGRTPPAMSAFEKESLGWGEIPVYSSSCDLSLLPVYGNDVGAAAGKFYTDIDGEYFYFESRGGGNVWDSYISNGMLIYHVDQSASYMSYWNYNMANAYADHPCYYIVKAAESSYYSAYPFPGSKGVTSFDKAIGWSGNHSGIYLSDISYASSSGISRLKLTVDRGTSLSGKVTNSDGQPIQGAKIAIVPQDKANSLGISQDGVSTLKVMDAFMSDVLYSCETDSNGEYSIPLGEFSEKITVFVAKNGYFNRSAELSINSFGRYVQNFVLHPITEVNDPYVIKKYSSSSVDNFIGFTSGNPIMVAVKFSAEENSVHAGDTLSTISFYVGGNSGTVYVLVDYGSTRKLIGKMNSVNFGGITTADIKDFGLTIPADEDMYIGIGVTGSDTTYPIGISQVNPQEGGLMYSSFSLSSANWQAYNTANLILHATVTPADPATDEPDFPGDLVLIDAGFSVIDALQEYKAGDSFRFRLKTSRSNPPVSVKWLFDGVECDGEKLILTKGSHKVQTELVFEDGKTSTLIREINVK